MNPNHSNFAACDNGTVSPDSGTGSPQKDHFAARIRAFEQCCTLVPVGIAGFLRIAVADLFRAMPLIERDVVGEIGEAFETPSVHKRPGTSAYIVVRFRFSEKLYRHQ